MILPLNKSFFKFFFSFIFIISVSFLIIVAVSYLGEGVQNVPEVSENQRALEEQITTN